MPEVFLIRHGQTYDNVNGVHQGWSDSRLNEVGIAQAQALHALLAPITFDRIISSDLFRTRQTCEILFGADAEIEYDPRLREINNTVLHESNTRELYERYGEPYRDHCRHLDFSEYGGESSQSLLRRTADFLAELARDTKSCRVAVVSHGGAMRAMIAGALGMPLLTTKLAIDNCSVTRLVHTDFGWCLVQLNNKTEI